MQQGRCVDRHANRLSQLVCAPAARGGKMLNNLIQDLIDIRGRFLTHLLCRQVENVQVLSFQHRNSKLVGVFLTHG